MRHHAIRLADSTRRAAEQRPQYRQAQNVVLSFSVQDAAGEQQAVAPVAQNCA